MKHLSLVIALLIVFAVAASAQCVWGSFDQSRINYSGGTLTGSAHTTLAGIITGAGGTLAAPTPLLTDAYLAEVDVFYTSLLSTQTGTLSADEQDALHTWIANGGTLIVTADIFPLPAYESFTAYYGVTNYNDLGNSGNGTPVGDHPIMEGVDVFYYVTESTFTYGADAMLLGLGVYGDDFCIVMTPCTGFDAGGRILVFGDHNMFANSYIGSQDNMLLATNFVEWACSDDPSPPAGITWGAVKSLFRPE